MSFPAGKHLAGARRKWNKPVHALVNPTKVVQHFFKNAFTVDGRRQKALHILHDECSGAQPFQDLNVFLVEEMAIILAGFVVLDGFAARASNQRVCLARRPPIKTTLPPWALVILDMRSSMTRLEPSDPSSSIRVSVSALLHETDRAATSQALRAHHSETRSTRQETRQGTGAGTRACAVCRTRRVPSRPTRRMRKGREPSGRLTLEKPSASPPGPANRSTIAKVACIKSLSRGHRLREHKLNVEGQALPGQKGWMVDVVDKATRSRMMSGIRGKDTQPELLLRRALHRLGLRYRVHVAKLPGRPDIVLARHNAVVLVHGCFWHRHRGCLFATNPASNAEFWKGKFADEQGTVSDQLVKASCRTPHPRRTSSAPRAPRRGAASGW